MSNVSECIESGEKGWQMSVECIESGEKGWQMLVECIESGEKGWRMLVECIESGEKGWRMSGKCIESDPFSKKEHFAEYSNSTNSLKPTHSPNIEIY
jgi:hypothetical protein